MNNSWVIVRTALAKEFYVARQIELMGFSAWVPIEYSTARIFRKSKTRKLIERPVLSKCLLCDVPTGRHGDLQRIRYYDSVQRDTGSQPLLIPFHEIQRFREILDKHNAVIIALSLKTDSKTKAKWKSMRDALKEMLDIAGQKRDIAA